MSFLVFDGTVSYMSAESVKIVDRIPPGVYKTKETKTGIVLETFPFKFQHKKIYGKSKDIAEHICGRYSMGNGGKNLGVLLSGGKGLGKSLTAKLIVENMKDTFPVIFVDEYTESLPDFLSHVAGSVIIFDEFEKTMSGNADSDDSGGRTKQESLLSVFDGTNGDSGNLYILTVNNVRCIDDNFFSRPGRIRYHYKFDSVSEDTIKEYCEDHLSRKELISNVVASLETVRFVSLDIVSALVDELNRFDVSVEQAMKYLNIECPEITVEAKAVFNYKGKEYACTNTICHVKPTSKRTRTTFDFEGDDNEWRSISVDIDFSRIKIPMLGYVDGTASVKIANGGSEDTKLVSILFAEDRRET